MWQHEEYLLHRPHLSLWAKQAASAGGDDDSSLSSENMGRRNGVVADKEMLSVKWVADLVDQNDMKVTFTDQLLLLKTKAGIWTNLNLYL